VKTRILIVDDEQDFVQALTERLAIRDFQVATAYSGKEAVKKVKAYNYDVVILDVLMPGMDGLATLHAIKEIKPLTEVIMLTGNASVETAIEGMKQGALDFLMKPCDPEKLHAKIKKAQARKAEHEERIREAKVQQLISSPRPVLKDD
jgi:DNA-binding NtrC family response regulator